MGAFEVVVVGLGHAGCEAALACARMGLNVAAVTLDPSRAGVMSCNPAIGGTAKGHLVRELDALGGQMARTADAAGTHFVTLNASKGPAVQATRVLCDRDGYAQAAQAALAREPRVTVVRGEVREVLVDGAGGRRRCRGVRLSDGAEVEGRCVVVTTGTFLQAVLHRGEQQEVGGRLGDAAAVGLSAALRALGFELARFKTGTPARLLRASIDVSRCQRQPSEAPRPFSARTPPGVVEHRPRVDCYVTHTTERTHALVRAGLPRSPLFQGRIEGRGPRYCPSLEDKVHRFSHRPRHTVFLEPEGPSSPLVYPAGLSTSLPEDVQVDFLRTIPGLEQVEVERFGYAVEYDYAPPTQLAPTLETRAIEGLFFAGQLNGTSGYEEAAVQGLLAGINAGLQAQGAPALVLGRDEAHAAVLVDDLVTLGVDEPLRMMTSRSEHRLKLREATARWRLARHGHRVGLVDGRELEAVQAEVEAVQGELARLRRGGRLPRLLVPGARWDEVTRGDDERPALPPHLVEAVEVEARYAPYIAQADSHLARQAALFDDLPLPAALDYRAVVGLSTEARERLTAARPRTFADLRRLRGVTPAAATLVLVHARRLVEARGGGDAPGGPVETEAGR
ncbi:MAG: tRNA uridine-5-carboxymethylaminomethyl(34) synthesis enzyme MnmG [Myxococcaceae bacterium]|jgi:tRNA uridine 5-carboxymethylaminomethyl modification enzyme|nr:tRNA uridine-5-carboxymethylaminomethyl(34) synthesis enzyme MnmG [Myxococcaceae bacterium]MCA3013475.1 tRNA uridine-5-carboxymethylaminomethyl(34) synthesis enzyme MnmG [Myxococcaceae bacterium]